MTPQQQKNKISELEQWLQDNPNHPSRTIIETDLRRIKEQPQERPIERDTFDLREHNFYNL
jgi:outer membrane PBP1 activator LpoA protein